MNEATILQPSSLFYSTPSSNKNSLLNSIFQTAIKPQQTNHLEITTTASSSNVTLRRSKNSLSHKTPPSTQQLIHRATSLCIQNTPTPILNQRYAQRTSFAAAAATLSITKNKHLIIPNTPSTSTFNNTANKTNKKKLLDLNGGYFAADKMPGTDESRIDENEDNEKRGKEASRPFSVSGGGVSLQAVRQTNAEADVAKLNKNVASLFKPKAVTTNVNDSKNGQDQNQGSDLSYETLKKMERRRKPVVRLSEVMRNQSEEKNDKEEEKQNEASKAILTTPSSGPLQPQVSTLAVVDPLKVPASVSIFENILLQNNTNQINSSPIVIQQNRNKINPLIIKSEETTVWSNDLEENSYSTWESMNSLTKVSRFVHTRHVDTSIYNDKLNATQDNDNIEKESVLTETECLDLVLFDGLKIKSPTPKTISKINTETKSNGVIDISRVNSKRRLLLDKTNINKNLKVKKQALKNVQSLTTPVPSKPRKRFNISFLGLSDETKFKMTRAINCLDQARQQKEGNQSEIILAKVSEAYNQRTTHLVTDFNRIFQNDDEVQDTHGYILSFHEKCVLILAALNRCKIVTYKWLKRSQQNMKWLDEEHFSIENSLDEDLYSYDQNHFDVKLINLIRQLSKDIKIKRNTFASFKNIFVMEEDSSNDHYNTANQSNIDENDFDGDISMFSKKNELSNSWFTIKQNTTYDYLTEIMTKCGACLTSRVALAEFIVAIDKTNDYNSETSNGQVQLEKDIKAFRDGLVELSRKLRSKQAGIKVIAADWIIDTVLEENNYDLNAFELTSLNIETI